MTLFKRIFAIAIVFTLVSDPVTAATLLSPPASRPIRAVPVFTSQTLSLTLVAVVFAGMPWLDHQPAIARRTARVARASMSTRRGDDDPSSGDRDILLELKNVLSQLGDEMTAFMQEKRSKARFEEKPNRTFVTKIDYAVQRKVVKRILGDPRFAHVYIDAEEDMVKAGVGKDLIDRNKANFGKARIIISMDPLDGTSLYGSMMGHEYAFAAALLYNGFPEYVIVQSPESHEKYEADRETGNIRLNGMSLHPSWGDALSRPPRIIAKGSGSRGIPHPLKEVLGHHFIVADRADPMILRVAQMTLRDGVHGKDAIDAATNPAHDAIPSAALIELSGGKTCRPDGTPFFPIQWDDITPKNREKVPLIAGGPGVVDQLVALRRALLDQDRGEILGLMEESLRHPENKDAVRQLTQTHHYLVFPDFPTPDRYAVLGYFKPLAELGRALGFDEDRSIAFDLGDGGERLSGSDVIPVIAMENAINREHAQSPVLVVAGAIIRGGLRGIEIMARDLGESFKMGIEWSVQRGNTTSDNRYRGHGLANSREWATQDDHGTLTIETRGRRVVFGREGIRVDEKSDITTGSLIIIRRFAPSSKSQPNLTPPSLRRLHRAA